MYKCHLKLSTIPSFQKKEKILTIYNIMTAFCNMYGGFLYSTYC